jgi:hypothetical protein
MDGKSCNVRNVVGDDIGMAFLVVFTEKGYTFKSSCYRDGSTE